MLRRLVREQNDRTLDELRAQLAEAGGPHLGRSTLHAALARLGLPRKKSIRASEQDRPDVVAARAAFRETVATLALEDLVFVDKSGVDTRLVRRYARAPAGARAVGTAPMRYKRLTVVGALATAGLVAPRMSEHAMNAAGLLAYLNEVLVPTVVGTPPSTVVILNDLKPHRVAAVRATLEAAGLRLMYLPPYSPDFAPIEPAWSKFKTLLRTAAARTRDALTAAVELALAAISASDARGYFTHCGYPVALN